MGRLNQTRRALLKVLGTAVLPSVSLPGFVKAAGAMPATGRVLVLIELAGGNDGLNTIVPIRDPAYRTLRKEIGIRRQDALLTDEDTGFHPALRPLAALWERGEVQVVEGVGYPDPNRSHFRSIEIWNVGLGAHSEETEGWVASAFEQADAPGYADADGLVLGGEMGPLSGRGRFSSLEDPDAFVERLAHLPMAHAVRPSTARSPLEHVLATYESARITGAAIQRRLQATADTNFSIPDTGLGEQLRVVARLLEAGVAVPVLKVEQGGYDTHAAQPDQHADLLEELAGAIAGFAGAMRDIGRWDDVTVVTYSEFGRTARENASGGTDHGTAAPVLLAGGSVRGGLSGARPSLEALVDGDLAYTTDYRMIYGSILRELWGIDAPIFDVSGAPRLQLLG